MRPTLLPVPLRPDLQVPKFKDLAEAQAFIERLVRDYEQFRATVFQNTNRLSQPGRDELGELKAEVHELGRLLAALTHGQLGETLDGLTDPARQFTTEDTRRIVGKYRHINY